MTENASQRREMVRKRHVGLQGEGGKGWCWRDEEGWRWKAGSQHRLGRSENRAGSPGGTSDGGESRDRSRRQHHV